MSWSRSPLAPLSVLLICLLSLLLTSVPAAAEESVSPLPPRQPGHVYVARFENGISNGFYQVPVQHYLDAQYTLISNGLKPSAVRIDMLIRGDNVEENASQSSSEPKVIILHYGPGGPGMHWVDPWRYMELIDILLQAGYLPTPGNVDAANDGDWDRLE